ncbi:MAG TPA: MBOAT family protein [Thermoanaerobaculia bacterium]|nr:MBOAT family protein [Thermoanaerobaculia bacterium]
MVFSSQIFLFLFLPLFLALYYLVPDRFRSALILTFSIVFYGWWQPEFLALLFGCLVVSYTAAWGVIRASTEKWRFRSMAIGVTLDLAALAWFKYANFGVESFHAAMQTFGIEPSPWTDIILPIGLSFYIFQAISYIVDVYRGDAEPTKNFIDFAAFIAMFPQLVAGPVLRYQDVADQFRFRTHSLEKFSAGSVRFMVGFTKKVLIADSVAPLVTAAFSTSSPNFGDAWLGLLAYTIQIYFDFSGYSDMAIGLGMMIGFVFPENFNDPYISRSITEFWRRWHISLSTWLREYLYIPLGGNRKGLRRTYVNLLITMVLGGLWHGANWTFIAWGAWHGGLLAYEKWRLQKRGGVAPAARWWSMPRTMFFVMIGWMIFRAPDLATASRMYKALFGLSGFGFSGELAWQITPDRLTMVVAGLVLVYTAPAWRRILSEQVLPTTIHRIAVYWTVLLPPVFFWALATLNAQSFSPFLYYQF